MNGSSAYSALTRWDAAWYRRIADNGYGDTRVAPDGRLLPDFAFFPLYPAAERFVSAVTSLATVDAGLLVSGVSSVVAAAGIYRVGERLHGARTGLVLVCLWSSLPVAIVQSMAYAESLFTALGAWTLYALLLHRYTTAGAVAVLAGLTRPLGVAVVAAVLAATIVRLLSLRRPPVNVGHRAAVGVAGPLLGAVLAPMGLVGYMAYVAWSRGSPRAYLDVTEQWGNGFDGGRRFIAWTTSQFLGGPVVTGTALLTGVILLGLAVRHTAPPRYPMFIFVFTLMAVAVTLSTESYFGSKPRYLVPAFTLLLWPAVLTRRLKTWWLIALLFGLAALSAAYGAIWLLGPGPP